jgi:hypothetical protein
MTCKYKREIDIREFILILLMYVNITNRQLDVKNMES